MFEAAKWRVSSGKTGTKACYHDKLSPSSLPYICHPKRPELIPSLLCSLAQLLPAVMMSESHEDVVAVPVAEASTATPRDLPHVTQSETQQKRRDDLNDGNNDGSPEMHLGGESESKSKSRIEPWAAKATIEEVSDKELRLPVLKFLLSTVASSRA